jgi:hypothetical protein
LKCNDNNWQLATGVKLRQSAGTLLPVDNQTWFFLANAGRELPGIGAGDPHYSVSSCGSSCGIVSG